LRADNSAAENNDENNTAIPLSAGKKNLAKRKYMSLNIFYRKVKQLNM
jgi:hypothetical protein